MTLTVAITKTVYGGDGLGRLGDGRVVFVPGAFAGEKARVELTEEHRHFVRARLVELVETAPQRLGAAPAPIPGMAYANLAYAAEKAAKAQQLADFLDRARLGAPAPGDLWPDAPESSSLHYRNKAVYHFGRHGRDWTLGYREEPSHRLVSVTDDPLAMPGINAAQPEIRRMLAALLTQGAASVRQAIAQQGNVTVRWADRSGLAWWIGRAPDNLVLREATCGRVFEVPADGFYQVNPAAAERLVKAVADAFAAGADRAGDVLDLYCGVGVFGLCCAGRGAQRLTGVESGRRAVEFAKRNAAAQGVEARFFAEEVGRSLKRLPIRRTTTVIVDPPRDGLEPGVAAFLAQSPAPRILYVSCDPATLTRDLRTLAAGYDITSVSWVNMFPRTACFETFVVLEKRTAR